MSRALPPVMDALGWMGDLAARTSWLLPFKALLASFVFGQILAWTYEFTYRGLSYSRGFAQSVILTCVAAATLMLAMGHSLVAGLGLLGVLSMVRFRTTLKSPRDLVFVMGAATVGIACGVDAVLAAACGAVGFSAVALYLHGGAFGSRARFDGVLRFRVPAAAEVEPRLGKLLAEHCSGHAMLSVGEVAGGQRVEHAYQVKFWREGGREGLVSAIREDLEAKDVVLLLQETAMEY